MLPFSTLALLAATASASVYVTSPLQSTSCTGGQSCLVTWVDDGVAPLLSSIAECTVGVYTGTNVLVQSVPSVDVSSTSSLSFTPSPDAGPDGQYYVVFTSNTITYTGYSATFTLNGMSGTAPSGGSSAVAPSPTPAGSSVPGTSPSGTPTDTTGTPIPSTSITTPATSTAPSATTSPTLTPTPSLNSTSSTISSTTSSTSTSSTTSSTTTTTVTASATPSNAAGRLGSPTSLGGIAALFVLLAF